MWYLSPWSALSPDERVGAAVAPFVVAMVLRFLLGRTQFTRWGVMLSTMWFAMNVLLAPYCTPVRQELIELGNRFR